MQKIDWWHVLTLLLFLPGFVFLIYVMTFVVMELATLLGILLYLLRF